MDKVALLEAIVSFTKESVKNLLLPVSRQKDDKDEPAIRPATVYKMRLPDSSQAKKKAPYIIHQIVTGKDVQQHGKEAESSSNVRSIFCVYCKNESEGAMHLLNLMERLRIDLLRAGSLDGRFSLRLDIGVETMCYTEDTAPYFIGEMSTTWTLPIVKREDVQKWL